MPRLFQHCLAVSVFCVGVAAAVLVSGAWERVLASGGCFIAVLWFPSACLELFRKMRPEGGLLPALILSSIAGFDGVIRLVDQSVRGGC
jgi:hypothetical protein